MDHSTLPQDVSRNSPPVEPSFSEEFALLLSGRHGNQGAAALVAAAMAPAAIGPDYADGDPTPGQFVYGATAAIAADLDTLANLLDLACVAVRSMGGNPSFPLDLSALQSTIKGLAKRLHAIAEVTCELAGGAS